MNNLPKGFYYNSEGVLINGNKKKSSIEKRVEALEKEVSKLKTLLKCQLTKLEP